MTDLITNHLDDYKRLSIKLGTDKEYLQKIKNRLSRSIPQSPLFDSASFTKDLEAIYSSLNNL
jgi:predicted O-linked N-acetylglucosamine transferase (SPINDLY family)